MTFSFPRAAEIATVVLEGEIGPAVVVALQRQVDAAFDAGQRRIVVDLRAVTVLDAQTVSMFCAALRRLKRSGATLAIVGVPSPVGRVLELCAIAGLELQPSAGAHVFAFERSTGAHASPRWRDARTALLSVIDVPHWRPAASPRPRGGPLHCRALSGVRRGASP
jgi:anti-anti-sigma factor